MRRQHYYLGLVGLACLGYTGHASALPTSECTDPASDAAHGTRYCPCNTDGRNGPIPSTLPLSLAPPTGQAYPPGPMQLGLDQANQAYGIDPALPAEERVVRVQMLTAAAINTIPEALRRPFAQLSLPSVLNALRSSIKNFYSRLAAKIQSSSAEAAPVRMVTTVHHEALKWYMDQAARPSEPLNSVQALSPYLLHDYVVRVHRLVFPNLPDSSRWETSDWMWDVVHDDQIFGRFLIAANYCIYLARFKCYTQALERSAATRELTGFIFNQLLDNTPWLREDTVSNYVENLWDNPTMSVDLMPLLKAALDHDQTAVLVNIWAEQYMQHSRVEQNQKG
ncbi:hypothetical protein H4R35_000403 [Dimargaris xerosporica]|nr:hypothetical protein H4R35_000403 [Dimargaris xerosporica]